MATTNINLSAFKKAVSTLGLALEQPENEFIRDAVIQRFEYTYELAWKILKLYLKTAYELDDTIPIKELFRSAGRLDLITVENWLQYHEARNLTTHTYNLDTAEEVYAVAKKFYQDAKKLLTTLESKLNEESNSSSA